MVVAISRLRIFFFAFRVFEFVFSWDFAVVCVLILEMWISKCAERKTLCKFFVNLLFLYLEIWVKLEELIRIDCTYMKYSNDIPTLEYDKVLKWIIINKVQLDEDSDNFSFKLKFHFWLKFAPHRHFCIIPMKNLRNSLILKHVRRSFIALSDL